MEYGCFTYCSEYTVKDRTSMQSENGLHSLSYELVNLAIHPFLTYSSSGISFRLS
jgi:hypothetical protein